MTRCRSLRRAFSLTDLLWIIAIIALLIAIALPSMVRARELAKRAVCASNLRGIGQGAHIYSNDYMEWFPVHYFDAQYDQTTQPVTTGVDYVGRMGSHAELKITEETTPDHAPRRGHPSRSMFLLVIEGQCTTPQFICPSTGDTQDELKDAHGVTAVAGVNRFDFKGYTSLSYGYQLPFGPAAQPRQWLDTWMPLFAEKGPYYQPGAGGMNGTTPDQRSAQQPPDFGASLQQILSIPRAEWRPYQSQNHSRGEGQNVLYIDGHTEFEKRPIIGLHNDNIYTIRSTDSDPLDVVEGAVPGEGDRYGLAVETDSFIIP